MTFFFSLLLVVFLWCKSNSLRCVNHTDQIIYSALYVREAKAFVDKLETTEGHKACYVSYDVIYSEKTFMVFFGEDLSHVPGDINVSVYFQMELLMAIDSHVFDPALGHKIYFFKCNDTDACERHFWRNHVDYFVTENTTNLENIFRSALITKIQEKGKTYRIN